MVSAAIVVCVTIGILLAVLLLNLLGKAALFFAIPFLFLAAVHSAFNTGKTRKRL